MKQKRLTVEQIVAASKRRKREYHTLPVEFQSLALPKSRTRKSAVPSHPDRLIVPSGTL